MAMDFCNNLPHRPTDSNLYAVPNVGIATLSIGRNVTFSNVGRVLATSKFNNKIIFWYFV